MCIHPRLPIDGNCDYGQLPLRQLRLRQGRGVLPLAPGRRRRLRPGGQLLVLEFFRDDPDASGDDRGVRGPLRFGLNTVVPALGKVVGRDGSAYRYLPSSMGEFLTAREFAALLEENGFENTFVERQTFGIAHIVGGRLKDE